LRKSWGATLVLEHADFLLHAGDKVALVGPNGSGKSTLFRLLAGETAPDLGDLVLKPGLRYGYLPQVPNVPPETVVRDVLSAPSPEAQRIEEELAGLDAWMGPPGRLGRRGRQRAHGPLRIPPRRPVRRPQRERDRQRSDPPRPPRRRGAPRPAVRLPL